jgi:hypothetical protein
VPRDELGIRLARPPADWARWIDESAGSAGMPADYTAPGLLAIVAGAIGAGVVVEPMSGWCEPLALWQCAVGSSGMSKSAMPAAGRRLIDGLEDDADEIVPKRVASESTLRASAGWCRVTSAAA